MNPATFAYLSRYFVALLLFLLTLPLLLRSIKDLRLRMVDHLQATPGHYLLVLQGQGRREQATKSIPLFHMTTLGRGKSCDIRLESEAIGSKHASIYRYQGRWFIRNLRSSLPVYLNGVEITQAVPLQDHDRITIGEVNLLYIHDQAAEEVGLLQGKVEYRGMLPTTGTWAWLNLFFLALAGLLFLLLRADRTFLRTPTLFLLGGLWLFFNLYYFVLPLLLKPLDRPAFLTMMLLCLVGVVMQVRLIGLQNWHRPMDEERMLWQLGQVKTLTIALFVGLLLLPIIALLVRRTRFLERLVSLCLVVTPLLLLLSLVLGRGGDTHGASLWIRIGSFSIQPTEFAKLSYLVVLAGFFKMRPPRRIQFAFGAWAATVLFLIMLLPDLGSAMIIMVTTVIVYVVMTSEYWITLGILLSGSAVAGLAIAIFPHVQRRLSGWTTLWTEVTEQNSQIVYGLQAIARGSLFGRGIGNGAPEGIPLASSDMVFAVICEELGMLAALAIVACFMLIWLRGAKAAVVVPDGFTSSLILGLVTALFLEAGFVICGVTGLLPLTGATLPFIAAGGSSLLAKCLLMALFFGLASRREEDFLAFSDASIRALRHDYEAQLSSEAYVPSGQDWAEEGQSGWADTWGEP